MEKARMAGFGLTDLASMKRSMDALVGAKWLNGE